MATSVKALIKPEILLWARKSAGYRSVSEASKKIGVRESKLVAWEAGQDRPTIAQLRKIANVYKRPLAVFYLPTPPKGVDVLHDFRTVPGSSIAGSYSPQLTYEIRRAYHRREKAIEMCDDLGETTVSIDLKASTVDSADAVAESIRTYLGVSKEIQESWKNPYESLNGWKGLIESRGILVFQSSQIEVTEMRGFSIATQPFPVIVLNSADAPFGRIFTLLHELTHIALRSDGVCTLDSHKDRTEIFCNAVAGATLLPKSWLTSYSSSWDDETIRAASKKFGASSQVVLRRLLTLGEITQAEYKIRKAIYEKEAEASIAKQSDKKIKLEQSTKAIAAAGKLFTKLVLDSYNRHKVTSSDVSDLLSVRIQHLSAIEEKVHK